MVNMDKTFSDFAILFLENKTTNNTFCAIVFNTSVSGLRITLISIYRNRL